jgi:hypothetical protein
MVAGVEVRHVAREKRALPECAKRRREECASHGAKSSDLRGLRMERDQSLDGARLVRTFDRRHELYVRRASNRTGSGRADMEWSVSLGPPSAQFEPFAGATVKRAAPRH